MHSHRFEEAMRDAELLELPGQLQAMSIKHRQENNKPPVFQRLQRSPATNVSSWEYGRWYPGHFAKREEALCYQPGRRLGSSVPSKGHSRHSSKHNGHHHAAAGRNCRSANDDVCGRCQCCEDNQFSKWGLPERFQGDMRYTPESPQNVQNGWQVAGAPRHYYSPPLSGHGSGAGSRNSPLCCCNCHRTGLVKYSSSRRGHSAASIPAGTQNPHLSSMATWLKGASKAEAEAAMDILQEKLGQRSDLYHTNFFHGPGTQKPRDLELIPSRVKRQIREERTEAWKKHQMQPKDNIDMLPDPKKTGTFLPPPCRHNACIVEVQAGQNSTKASNGKSGQGTGADHVSSATRYGGLYHRPEKNWSGEPSNVQSHFLQAQADHLRPLEYSLHPNWGLDRIPE
ncbi:uncharacterized protein LOC135823144 [Sycon ciliatum]|uniref:uncharacterized protein LOC135823144 n=1 Tax=Sycon ciliatum TaxID=27933 RepID=UPI0031F68E9A